jgi:2',3'-cyclic-nucleotide 2'-phosphodiesterase (5'-nucleotidase family)
MSEKLRNVLPSLIVYVSMLTALIVAWAIIHRRAAMEYPVGRFTILQTNDVYRIEGIERGTVGGLSRVRALRRELEKEGHPVLMLHAGDFLYPSVMSKYLEARPMVRCFNLLDGDSTAFDDRLVVTFGNHEFDKEASQDLLGSRIRESDFQWVASALQFRSQPGSPFESPSRRFKNVKDDVVVDLDGVKVGIVGLTLPDAHRDWVDYRYEDRNRLIREALERLKKQRVQVLVALTHQDFKEDIRLAKDFPELDLIIGGHEHSFHQKRIGHTWITKADADARSAVRIDVAVFEDGTVLAAPEKIDLVNGTPRDRAMDGEVKNAVGEFEDTYKAREKKDLEEKIATTDTVLEGIEPAIRGRETALGNLMADLIHEETGAPIAFINGGSIRINDNIPAGGQITRADLEGMVYYRSALVKFTVTGKDLLEILRNSVSQADDASGGFLQVSGLRFRYHVNRLNNPPTYTVNKDEVQVRKQSKSGRGDEAEFVSLKEEDNYQVATLQYLWEKGYKEGYKIFSGGKDGGTSPEPTQKDERLRPDLREVVERRLRAMKTVKTGIEGRIVRIEG